MLKTKNYKKSTILLSQKDKHLLQKQEKFLSENIFHPNLHTKKLKGFSDDKVFSFRITQAYRGIFHLRGQDVVLFAIGHRKDIYQSL
ncbi:MAG: hypothetical protein WC662_04565 [Candidatus Paceibacterota bacterium]